MQVIKRNGTKVPIQFDKISDRINKLISDEERKHKILDASKITFKLMKGNYILNNSYTKDIDTWTAEICGHESSLEPKYNELGGRICISNLHKKTGKESKHTKSRKQFSDVVTECYSHTNKLGEHQPLVNLNFYNFVMKHKQCLNSWVDYSYDYKFDYFAFKTLEKNYLLKSSTNDIIESPQDLLMRVSVALNMKDVENKLCDLDFIFKTYDVLRHKKYTHATPTLFNAGTNRQQLSSCFLVSIQDSLSEIYEGLGECAMISKNSGGIGIEIHDIRAKNSIIRTTNGKSNGIVPMLKVFESTARYVNQGGKRKGSIAVYLAGYHADIEDFLDLRKNVGADSERTRDLFLAVWLSDLFMKRVKNNEMWSLMCPDECKGLADVYGKEFETLYTKYESKHMYRKQVPARKIWEKIKISLIETGAPYIHFKDHINRKNNQKNIGVIRTSNLCLAPESLLLTDKGYRRIDSCENKNVNVWNGKEFSSVVVKQTSESSDLMTIQFSNLKSVTCTYYHKFYVKSWNKPIEAKHLKVGMELLHYYLPINENNDVKEMKGIRVVDISYNNRKDKTYCCNEPNEHKIVINGILTGNCSEIMEVTNKNESAVCNLASIALSKFVTYPFKSLKQKKFVLYSMKSCKPCQNLKSLLHEHNIPYTEYLMGSEQHKSFVKMHHKKTVPQLLIDDTLIGGFSEAKQLFRPVYDFDDLHKTAKISVYNLNKVIDINFYPTKRTQRSNVLHRPIGLGVQGLADVYCMMKYPFESKEAHQLNKDIFETIYHASLEASMEISKHRSQYMKPIIDRWNKPNKTLEDLKWVDEQCETYKILKEELDRKSHHGAYSTFIGSPYSQGQFQFHLWGKTWVNNDVYSKSQDYQNDPNVFTSKWDWDSLKRDVMTWGTRNSLLTSLMPTASTSQILGNNECFEPFTNNLYTRKTLAGLFKVINKYLIQDLKKENLWDENFKNILILNKGSIQNIEGVSPRLKQLYKTVWEIKQRSLIQQAVDRGPFIDQSQSMNLFFGDNHKVSKMLDSAIFLGWKLGLKTGLYYLRTKPATDAVQFTVDKTTIRSVSKTNQQQDDDECLMCGS